MADWANYLLLFLMFSFIIFSIVVVIYFSKWQILGPKVKNRWYKILGKNKGPSVVDGVEVKGSQVVIIEEYVNDIKNKIKNAKNPQELLEYQLLLEKHNKQVEESKAKIKFDEEAKIKKIKEKEDLRKAKEEAKKESEEIKRKQKEEKENSKKGVK